MNKIVTGTEKKLLNILSINQKQLSLLENINIILETVEKQNTFLNLVRQEFNILLTSDIIQVHSTVEKLAAFIDMLLDMREDEEDKPMKLGQNKGILSHNQDRMYLFDRFENQRMLYNMPFKFILNGMVDVKTLQLALNNIIERHKILRTNFKRKDHEIFQVVNKADINLIVYEDCRNLNLDEAKLRVNSYLNKEIKKCFDLENDLLFNMKLFQFEEDKYYLACNFHHIIFDGVSFEIFFKELMRVYELLQLGKSDKIPPIEMQYLDYASWQKRWIKKHVSECGEFWKKYLRHEEEPLALPYDFQRPKTTSYLGDRLELVIPNELRLLIEKVTRSSNTTLFTFMVTAYQTFLSQYTGKDQITVGSTVANRGQEDFAHTIGCFVNTLPFKITVENEASFRKILQKNKKIILNLLEQQHFPFEKIVEAVNPKRDLSYSPLFQTALAMEDKFEESFSNSFFCIKKEEFNVPFSNYDLILKVKNSHQLVLEFEYSTELFQHNTINRLMKSFKKWLFQICENIEAPLCQLEYLDNDQLNLLLSKWQGEAAEINPKDTIVSIFKKVVKNSPYKIAVVDDKKTITYLDLDKKSDVIANLIKKRVKGEVNKVGLHVNRSIDMIIGMLGIIKAGCAYVPLDPKLPSERLKYIIKNSKLDICITNQDSNASSIEKVKNRICLKKISYEVTKSHLKKLCPSDPAYIVYTSGTTGKPKGVMITNRGVVNLIRSQRKYLQLNEASRVLQFATFNFDASIYEIFGSLLNGAELHIGNNQEEMFDLYALEKQIINDKLTHLVLPPAVLKELNINNSSVEYIGSAGSECPTDLPSKYKNVNFYNAYGPTEYSVWSTFKLFKANDSTQTKNKKVSIGKPILNTNIYVLNPYQKLVPIGAIGEIYIGGKGLATEYINNRELTLDKFIENPFKVGERLYRSGDLGRFTENGELNFLGRIDNQIKIRGFRVELDEILITLKQFPTINDAFIKIKDHPEVNKQIIAYFKSNQQTDLDQLKNFLKERLPAYMIPTFIIQVDKFPLNTNGKIDSSKFPAPEIRISTELKEPKTGNEKILLEIFKQVLGIKRLSIHDNFFELGGDSIQSIQICSLARQKGITINPKSIFENQTVSELASVATYENKLVIKPVETEGYVKLTPIQEWFFAEHQKAINHWNQSVVFKKEVCGKEEDIENILSQIVKHHHGLSTLFEEHDNKYVGFLNKKKKTWELIYKDIHHLDEEKQLKKRNEWEKKIQSSLNIKNGPIMKMLVLKEQTNRYRFFWVIHHLLVDAVSWKILLEDFNYLHNQLLNDKVGKLPTQTSSFKDWSNFLRKYDKFHLNPKTIHYWKEKTNSEISEFKLTESFVSKDEITVEKSFDKNETDLLVLKLTGQSKATIEEVLLSFIVSGLNRSFEINDFWIEIEGHGREMLDETVDVTRTVGWFTVIYPILLCSDTTFSGTLKHTKNAIREIPNKGFDYSVIKYLRPGIISGPDAHVTFNYLGKLDSQFESSNSKDFGEFENKPRLHFLAFIQEGKLTIKIISKLDQKRIGQLIKSIDEIVKEVIQSQDDQSALMESDFPDAVVTEDDLLHILNSIN
ncbi:amino acid adenylation domain-containing protein [Priestia aryabhattai]|uniref:amino acid adenylation domain-containing protein n=1 Tax=Priestia TaxID=2800373 RepID=UPI0039834473